MNQLVVFLVVTFFIFGCNAKPEPRNNSTPKLFNAVNSDPAAVELADSIISSAGGKAAWEKIRFISWKDGKFNFYWDKKASNVRIADENRIAIINLSSRDGRIQMGGTEVADSTAVKQELTGAFQRWRLSSNKIFITYQLKEVGNSLLYFGEEIVNDKRYNVLEVNFKTKAGKTKYVLFVGLKNNRIEQLHYYPKKNQSSATVIFRYPEYKNANGIILSIPSPSDISNVRIGEDIPEDLFTDF
ncbi:MAG TPA: hypothetical protein VD927_00375 [Chryseosolibacter sp.]|nr:hypothetical protein [Chryseosolibacter sp.]